MSEQAPLPLAGIKVLEFSHAVMGPSAGMILADLGATVTKIEPVPDGDRTRHLQGVGIAFFPLFCRNKQSLAIDLKAPGSRPAIEALVAQSDILLENFALGTMDRLGLGYDELSAINPGLVYLQLKGFLSGPYEERRALDEIVQMMSGLAYMTGPPGRPLRAGASVVDIMGGMAGVIGILAALRERDATGNGQLVKAALFETAVFAVGQHMVQHAINGEPLVPMSVPNRAWGIYDTFESADGKPIFVGVVTDTQWLRFCDVFERPDLLADPRLNSNGGRVLEREWLVGNVAETCKSFSADELLARCDQAQLAFGPVNKPEDLLDDPHLNEGGQLRVMNLPGGIQAKTPRLPLEMAGRSFSVRQDPPAIGEHSRQVLADAGLSVEDIEALFEAGHVLETESEISSSIAEL
ncbi:MAG: CoA transferase [Rhodospirillaceae bacterium]|jgi:crotonobetainyl-CoA:carnitine CoA-transferase CaiB-like acyl-CoA transferase|nr:CoA transferase [Rhodospirillaceae bacterium]MBT4689914.1 CoA transferase [Rhodospirillaceae bacterium]MBT5081977.1 CoA transferase [Rhodospirillaceae bacterium]MBT5524815.1 CoA transferase [Rhodospirillaceae bacterium]MBT5881144.1 CoA transferase [Rhodospirillaceae bacterium]